MESLEDSLAQVAKVSVAAGLDGEKVRKHVNLSSIIATVSDRASAATIVARIIADRKQPLMEALGMLDLGTLDDLDEESIEKLKEHATKVHVLTCGLHKGTNVAGACDVGLAAAFKELSAALRVQVPDVPEPATQKGRSLAAGTYIIQPCNFKVPTSCTICRYEIPV